LETINAGADGILTVAVQQPSAVSWVISFAFVGLEFFTGIILAVILWFINVEKDIGWQQEEIRVRNAQNEQAGL
ncbi:MAG: hypothetical protein IJM63_00370, partial [Solobacterium sp.]|nr:hypothetical protein [Solobacterium sp.]